MIHYRPCRPMAGCGLVMMIIRGCPFITLYKFRVLRDPSTLCNVVIDWDAHSLWLVYFWMGWLLQENRREVLMCLWKKTLAEAQQTFISSKGKKGLRPSIFLLKLKRCNELESPPCPFEILKHEKPTSPFFYPVFVDIFQKIPSCLLGPGCLLFAFWSLVLVSSPLTQAS